MSASIPQAKFDMLAFDHQMLLWIQAGLTKEQISHKARKEWPAVPGDYLETTYSITRDILADEQVSNVDPAVDLLNTHRRRSRLLDQLDKRLIDDTVPITLLSLYRGLLRDHEASCYKMLAQREHALPVTKPATSIQSQSVEQSIPGKSKSIPAILTSILLFLCLSSNCGSSVRQPYSSLCPSTLPASVREPKLLTLAWGQIAAANPPVQCAAHKARGAGQYWSKAISSTRVSS